MDTPPTSSKPKHPTNGVDVFTSFIEVCGDKAREVQGYDTRRWACETED